MSTKKQSNKKQMICNSASKSWCPYKTDDSVDCKHFEKHEQNSECLDGWVTCIDVDDVEHKVRCVKAK